MFIVRKFTIIVGLLCSIAFAQIGIKGGPVVSDIVFAEVGELPYLGFETFSLAHRSPFITYQIGIFKQFDLSKKLDLQTELLFSKKGLNYSTDLIYANIKYYMSIYYLEVPFLLKYNIGNNEKWSILTGPYAALAMHNSKNISTNQNDADQKLDNVNKFDLGLSAGVSRSYFINGLNFLADIRFSYSLVDIMEFSKDYIPDYYRPQKERARNINISLTFGYIFK